MGLEWLEVGVLVLVLLTVFLVLFVALLVWRHGYRKGWRGARREPPTCLGCGYNLSGLTHCCCPECGREHRLDELWKTDFLAGGRSGRESTSTGSAEPKDRSL